MMRIIAGSARRRPLDTLDGDDITRPTSERVKEGLFSAIQFELEGRRVLDLFSGSGQLALEALSRGADSAVLIDGNVKAVEIIAHITVTINLILWSFNRLIIFLMAFLLSTGFSGGFLLIGLGLIIPPPCCRLAY